MVGDPPGNYPATTPTARVTLEPVWGILRTNKTT